MAFDPTKLRPIPGLGPGFYEAGPLLPGEGSDGADALAMSLTAARERVLNHAPKSPEDQPWNAYAFGQMTGLDIVAAWTLIAMILSEEGSAVTILSPNADFEGAAYAVEVTASWTGYLPRRYEGDTIIAALDAANRERAV